MRECEDAMLDVQASYARVQDELPWEVVRTIHGIVGM
jgi:hypothetical protein